MKRDDTQLGRPQIVYGGLTAAIEALPSPIAGMIAYATDAGIIGVYNGASWDWIGAIEDTVILAPGASTRNVIQPTGNYIPLTLKANGAQTEDLQQWQNSAGTVLARVKNDGQIQSDVVSAETTAVNVIPIISNLTVQPAGSSAALFRAFGFDVNVAAARTYSQSPMGLLGIVRVSAAAATDITAIEARAYIETGHAATIGIMRGILLQNFNAEDAAVSNAVGMEITMANVDTGSIIHNYGLSIQGPTIGSGSITNNRGLTIANISGASSTNYAIYTNAGLVRLGDQLSVIGSEDRIQAIVKGYSSQTANLQAWQNSAGAMLLAVDASGNVVIRDGGTIGQVAGPLLIFDDTNNLLILTGADWRQKYDASNHVTYNVSSAGILSIAPSGAGIWTSKHITAGGDQTGVNANFVFHALETYADPAASKGGVSSRVLVTLTGNNANSLRAINATALYTSGSNNITGDLYAIEMSAGLAGGTGTLTNAFGFRGGIVSTSAGIITNAAAVSCTLTVSAGTIVTSYGMIINTPSVTGSGAVTNLYGLYVTNMTAGGTLNYALYTNAGLVRLGDQLSIIGSADRIQQITKAYSSQTAAIAEWQKSDATVYLRVQGGGHLEFGEAINIVAGSTTGTKIGTATTQKLGFWNAAPVVQPAGAAQAAPAAYVTGAFGLDTNAHMQALYDLVVAMRTALVNVGIMKGAA